ncbi:AraC family transcriptional regulator [Actinobacteria bacterium YIM 96077]|uniref:AraC family transcriptional regulator n=1 Tax=Phytoactinopolyspora halophila TaxID=1981511 RepID=A0A329R108_9ACTN|nr:AraC family transcriptional regulator [Phytoactinopolyspora halophila]AYY11691.1 AraC family transcriptional regulator [Actinobacteria bacterium YIM 96077]RAW17876.1 AraC family transcriptional regulator [Phytoactinopolyspora halophila]
MDALTGLVDGTRARGALLHRTVLEPPWSLRIDDGAPLSLAVPLSGNAWIVPDDGVPTRTDTGDVAIVCGPRPYVVADDPATPPELVIRSGNRATTVDGVDVSDQLSSGTRTCGLDPDGSVVIVSVTYPSRGDVSARLLAALPHVLIVPGDDLEPGLMGMILAELEKDGPGQQAVLDRLLDLLLITSLRAWLARSEARAPAWHRAPSDPVVGTALRLIHDEPARPWTVERLAEAAGISRAALARRFTGMVGEPPMAYLTSWRVALAADLLRESDATVESIAHQVGYANAFALSVAFKRIRGINPTEHRKHAEPTTGDHPRWRARRVSPGRQP